MLSRAKTGWARALLAFTSAGYLLFDVYAYLFAPIPGFILAENLVYAAVFGIAALKGGDPRVLMAASIVAAFNAGRVSRSVLTATGTLAPLAYQHAPLLIWLVLLSLALLWASAAGDRR